MRNLKCQYQLRFLPPVVVGAQRSSYGRRCSTVQAAGVDDQIDQPTDNFSQDESPCNANYDSCHRHQYRRHLEISQFCHENNSDDVSEHLIAGRGDSHPRIMKKSVKFILGHNHVHTSKPAVRSSTLKSVTLHILFTTLTLPESCRTLLYT